MRLNCRNNKRGSPFRGAGAWRSDQHEPWRRRGGVARSIRRMSQMTGLRLTTIGTGYSCIG
jgi:hypothetical protein